MASIEIIGLDPTLEHPEAVTDANFAVVRDGKESAVHVLKLPGGWFITTIDEEGYITPTDAQLDGSFTDAALYGIGLALERSGKALVTA